MFLQKHILKIEMHIALYADFDRQGEKQAEKLCPYRYLRTKSHVCPANFPIWPRIVSLLPMNGLILPAIYELQSACFLKKAGISRYSMAASEVAIAIGRSVRRLRITVGVSSCS